MINAAFAILVLCGCVGVSLCQTNCAEEYRLRECVTTYNTTVTYSGGNYQAVCDAANTLMACFGHQYECASMYNLQQTYYHAQSTVGSPPCSDAQMASSAAAAVVNLLSLLCGALVCLITNNLSR